MDITLLDLSPNAKVPVINELQQRCGHARTDELTGRDEYPEYHPFDRRANRALIQPRTGLLEPASCTVVPCSRFLNVLLTRSRAQ
jgi:hypothetical protein